VAVGSNDEVFAAVAGSPSARVVDLEGRLVLPGFIDGHTHLLWLGQSLCQLDLSNCGSIEELRRRLKERADGTPAGGWILGWGWHQERFAEKRDPVRHDIDDVTPLNPVYLVRSCTHTALVNTVALRAAGIGKGAEDPPGGRIVLGPDMEPVGLLHENAMHLVARLIPKSAMPEKKGMLRTAMEELLKHGVTSAHSIDSGCADAFRQLSREGSMPIRVYMDEPFTSEEEIASVSRRTGEGDEWFRIGSVKFWADGAFGPRTAALREPYADDPDNRGLLVYDPETLKRLAVAAARMGRQVTIHALGDRAMDVALDALDEAAKAGSRRPRVVHCGLTDAEVIGRMRRLGAIADLQPCFIPYEVDWMPRRLGPERAGRAYAIRTLLDAGICCTAGSDAPVDPVDPLIGIYGAVTRAGLDGLPADGWNPGERVTVEEAVRMYTVNGSYAEFSEEDKGMISVGYLADMVVLSRNIFEISPAEIPFARAAMTIVGGDVKWVDETLAGIAEVLERGVGMTGE